ncbi:MAG TPA: proton-conducting transporter membrane subunit [Candidatus Dormibacteraeota bacterium]|nr:proton-conducting transporter membrane subunit [Candidatus Dormibacteraeota bacterium]
MRTTALAPEVVILGTSLLLLLGRRVLPPSYRAWFGAAALVAAVVALGLELWLGAAVGTLFDGGWQQDRFALFAKAALLLGLIVLIASSLWSPSELEENPLPAVFVVAFGGMVAASATSLVALWAGLEVAALAAIAVAGLSAREAGTRLLLTSAVGAALLAVGFAFLIATAGDASLAGLRTALRPSSVNLSLTLAVLLTLTGVAIRLGLAPFQWLAVEGGLSVTPLGAGALGGLLVGVAAIVAARLLAGLESVNMAWWPWLAVLSAAAMLLGGLRAATAGSPRAVAAWLLVAQVGWVSAGLAAHDRRGSAGALLVMGALLLAATAAPALARGEEGLQLAALRRNQPLRALGLVVLLLSLAGAPPLAGFVGQFAVAAELVRSNLAWLLAVGLLGSLLSVVAAVRVIRLLYLETSPDQPRTGRGARMPERTWSPVTLVPALMVLLYTLLANPISGLALQGAAALKLP